MRNDYFNASHLPDPTAYEALVNVTREEERRRRNRRRAKSRDPNKPPPAPGNKPFEEALKCYKP